MLSAFLVCHCVSYVPQQLLLLQTPDEDVPSGVNCIKIGLPGKLILSKRKGLLEVKYLYSLYSLENSLGESIFREDLFYTIGPCSTTAGEAVTSAAEVSEDDNCGGIMAGGTGTRSCADIIALKHVSRILGHCNSPGSRLRCKIFLF